MSDFKLMKPIIIIIITPISPCVVEWWIHGVFGPDFGVGKLHLLYSSLNVTILTAHILSV